MTSLLRKKFSTGISVLATSTAAIILLTSNPALAQQAATTSQPGESAAGQTDKSEADWETNQKINVRFVDATTKAPVPDVHFTMQYAGKGIKFSDVDKRKADAEGQGEFTLPNVPPSSIRLYTRKPGYVPLRVYWENQPFPILPKTVTIELPLGRTFGGRVVDQNGTGIPDVEVSFDHYGTGKGEMPHVRHNITSSSKTDEKGNWQVDYMPAKAPIGDMRIFFSHPDFIGDRPRPAITPMPIYKPDIKELYAGISVITMKSGELLQGRVSDEDGKPVANAKIFRDEYYWLDGTQKVVTDAEGNFELRIDPDSPGGRFTRDGSLPITIEADGFATELVKAKLEDSPLDIEMKPGHTLQGTVIDEEGQPIVKASVYARTWRGESHRINAITKTDEDGKFELTNMPTDEVKFNVSKSGYMSLEGIGLSANVKPDGTRMDGEPYSLTLLPPLKVTGSVTDAVTGQALKRYRVMPGIDYDDGRNPHWMRHDRKTINQTKYEHVFDQKDFVYRIRIEADGYLPAISRLIKPNDPDKGEINIDFALTKAEKLKGQVIGLSDLPLADAAVYLSTGRINIRDRKVTSADSKPLVTDPSGEFEFPPESEPYCLVVVHDDGIAMLTDDDIKKSSLVKIEPWSEKHKNLQIIRKPANGQHADFP